MKTYATYYGQDTKFIAPGRLVTVEDIAGGLGTKYAEEHPGFAYHIEEIKKDKE